MDAARGPYPWGMPYGNHLSNLCVTPSNIVRGWSIVIPRAEEFRKCADECYRLSTRLKYPEHKAFALYLASAWITLAEHADRKKAKIVARAAPDVTMAAGVTMAASPPPPNDAGGSSTPASKGSGEA
jgi:hypothetical protein